eukprot:Gb_34841 [translate_table: standard]
MVFLRRVRARRNLHTEMNGALAGRAACSTPWLSLQSGCISLLFPNCTKPRCAIQKCYPVYGRSS